MLTYIFVLDDDNNFEGEETNLDEILEDFNQQGNEEGQDSTNDIKNTHGRQKSKENLKCPKCECTLDKYYLQRHLKTCKGKRQYQCDKCPKSFAINRYLSDHKRKIHGEESTACNDETVENIGEDETYITPEVYVYNADSGWITRFSFAT